MVSEPHQLECIPPTKLRNDVVSGFSTTKRDGNQTYRECVSGIRDK